MDFIDLDEDLLNEFGDDDKWDDNEIMNVRIPSTKRNKLLFIDFRCRMILKSNNY